MQDVTNSFIWVGAWPFPVNETDLVIDLTDSVDLVDKLGGTVDPAFLSLHAGAQWRSVTLAGASMPQNFTGVAAGLYTIDRAERLLWQRLAALALPYRLDFGDYATVSIAPAPSGIRWGYPITAATRFSPSF